MNMRASIDAAQTSGPLEHGDGAMAFAFRFAADDPAFAGHFPTRPLLPGVFQLEMARRAAEGVMNCPLSVREVCRAKFLRPILPEEIVLLKLKLAEKDGGIQAQAEFSVGGQAAGRAVLFLWRND